MSAEQVKKNIIHGFSDKVDKDNEHFINFLQPDLRTHTLTKLEGSNFDGADVIDIAGQGSLYVHIQRLKEEVQDDVIGTEEVSDDKPSCSGMQTNPIHISHSDSDSEEEVPHVSFSNRDYSSWRELRRMQDEEFAESLRVDQEKVNIAEQEKERKEKMEDIRNMLKLKFSGNQAKESSIHLAFRFPDGKKLNYIFDGHDTTMVYRLVFNILFQQ
jgi:hypothetical protein